MKLGIAYNLFDGEELLEYSIRSVRNNTDFVSVIYQEISYHGLKCSDGMLDFLLNLKDQGLIDEIVLFEPDIADTSGENASLNETRKRNLGLEVSRKNGCTHHMSMDVDEFYTEDQFAYMKNAMESGDFDCAGVQHCQYYKDSIYILKKKEQEYVTTIEKINPETNYVYWIDYPVPVDPTRKTNNKKCRVFSRDEVEMHHMSFVRKDIKKKLSSSAVRSHLSEELINRVDEHHRNWKFPDPAMWAGGNLLEVIEVPRLFKIYN
jgi:hypothetical protein